MNKLVFIFVVLFLSTIGMGQNLVPNFSFENFIYCPIGTAQSDAVAEWYNVTAASPDYYNACATSGADVPANDWGYQFAQDGEAYIGLATYYADSSLPEYREYMQVKLMTPLVAEETYCWSMWISLLDNIDFASNNLGIGLSNAPVIDLTTSTVLPIICYGFEPNVQYDSLGWFQIEGSFTAIGGEEYLTLGNFFDNASTIAVQVAQNSMGGNGAYYFIDNVYLGLGDCVVEAKVEVPNVFTPNDDGLNDSFDPFMIGTKDTELKILDRWGNILFSSNVPSWDGSFKGKECQDGTYFYVLTYLNEQTNNVETKTGFFQLIR